MTVESLDGKQMRQLLTRVAELGYDTAMQLLNDGETQPRRRSPLRDPWKRDQVIAAYNLKLMTREEARRLLGIRRTRQ